MTSDELRSALRSDDPAEQAPAIVEAMGAGAVDMVPDLVPLTGSPDDAVRASAAAAIGRLGSASAASVGPVVLRLLEDEVAIVRSDAAEALGQLGYERGVDALAELLRGDPETFVRASAAEALGLIGSARAIPSLVDAARSEDEVVGAAALNALGFCAASEFVTAFGSLIAEPTSDGLRRFEFHAARYRLGDRPALHTLRDLLDEADEETAADGLNVLEDLGVRRPPSYLKDDIGALAETLQGIARRFPALASTAAEVDRLWRNRG